LGRSERFRGARAAARQEFQYPGGGLLRRARRFHREEMPLTEFGGRLVGAVQHGEILDSRIRNLACGIRPPPEPLFDRRGARPDFDKAVSDPLAVKRLP